MLGVHLSPHDSFPADDHAELELPSQPTLPVTVYSSAAGTAAARALRHAARHRRLPQARRVSRRRQGPGDPRPLHSAAAARRPIPSGSIRRPGFADPGAQHAWSRPRFTAGTRTIRPPPGCTPRISSWSRPRSSRPAPSDGRIGEVAAGPVIVARPGNPKIVVLGFHPVLTGMRYELATPLLFANLLRWIVARDFPPLGDLRRQRGRRQTGDGPGHRRART